MILCFLAIHRKCSLTQLCVATGATIEVWNLDQPSCTVHSLHTDDILLATYGLKEELRIYRLSLLFDTTTVNLHHLEFVTSCTPSDGSVDSALLQHTTPPASARLSFLDFIPAGPEFRNREPTQPFVLATFTYVSDASEDGSNQFSIVCRWGLRISKPTMHPSFDQLSSRKSNVPSTADLPVGSGVL